MFQLGDKYVELGILDPQTGDTLRSFIYTPVRQSLRSAAERLGDLLHALKKYREDTDPWWVETRQFLEGTWKELHLATRGELLGVPLIDRSTGHLRLQLEIHDGGSDYAHLIEKGAPAMLGVQYYDGPPPSLGAT